VFTYIWVSFGLLSCTSNQLIRQLGSQLAADAAITILIIVKLLSSRTGWKQTDTMIHKLVV
jgi:hypothetical protein